jgi:hypothetical protein
LGITPEDGQTRPPEALRGRVRIAASVQGGVRDHGRRGCTHRSRRVVLFFRLILFSGLLHSDGEEGQRENPAIRPFLLPPCHASMPPASSWIRRCSHFQWRFPLPPPSRRGISRWGMAREEAQSAVGMSVASHRKHSTTIMPHTRTHTHAHHAHGAPHHAHKRGISRWEMAREEAQSAVGMSVASHRKHSTTIMPHTHTHHAPGASHHAHAPNLVQRGGNLA